MDENFFTLAHPEYLEPVDLFVLTTDFASILAEVLPPHWTVNRHGPWLSATDGRPVVPQGFKIHVSSAQRTARATLRVVAEHCVARGVTFKVAGDPTILRNLNGRQCARGSAGKFMTLYPATDAVFRELIEALYQATRTSDLGGPYVLSDRRYRDSRLLSYRYGGFRAINQLRLDGTRSTNLRAPDGTLVADERVPFYELPEWVAEPFQADDDQSTSGELLHSRYRVLAPLKFSNSGGVYRAVDEQTGQTVVVKEARPLTQEVAATEGWVDACDMLAWEWRMLQHLRPLSFVPQPIDFFQEWEHRYLVQELVPGVTFWSFWASHDNVFAPYVQWPDAVRRFVPKFARLAWSLIDALEAVHAAGVIVQDLSPRNIMVDPRTLTVRLIDLEAGILRDDGQSVICAKGAIPFMSTPGFAAPDRRQRRRVEVRDDFYSAGMVLCVPIVPAVEHCSINPDARSRFLDAMVRAGVPDAAREVIEALLRGEPAAARQALAILDPSLV